MGKKGVTEWTEKNFCRSCCGETAGANWIRLVDGQTLCLDCAGSYDRFDV